MKRKPQATTGGVGICVHFNSTAPNRRSTEDGLQETYLILDLNLSKHEKRCGCGGRVKNLLLHSRGELFASLA
jgi:hypothetical protein